MPDVQRSPQEQILSHRLALTGRRLAGLRRTEGRFPWIRLGLLVIILVVAFFAFQLLPFRLAGLVVLLPLALFVLVTRRHNSVVEQITLVETFSHQLNSRLARLRLDWAHIPPAAPLAVSPGHPFASDLDIMGPRSLHQLLDTSAALGGSQRLADWLLASAPDLQAALRRQELVQELLARPALRTRLELEGMLANPSPPERWDTSGLLVWLDQHIAPGSFRPLLDLLVLLAIVNILLFCLYAFGPLPPLWLISLTLYLGLLTMRNRQIGQVFDEAYTLANHLGRLRVVLAELETIPFHPGSRLADVCAPLRAPGQRPSAALRRIGWVVSATSLRHNPLLAILLNTIVPWDLFFAYQLERIKLSLRGLLPAWLNAWHELEALAAMANFAALHPGTTFPSIHPQDDRPVFSASALGHPLIPAPVRITNDFYLARLGQVVIITGSNMSGKSTFLRTLGINLILAFAGSPVPASCLETIPFRVFTSMTLNDSLNDGISLFYAEVRRLSALLDQLKASHPAPLFFLIDEIFRGTNNRERRVGARAYMQALTARYGVGFISTHDIELAHLAEASPPIQNFHFREDIHGDEMVFDYTIRPGPSQTTNALRIMALAGLPVPPAQEIGEPDILP